MFNYRTKSIDLGKLPLMSMDGYWEPDVNDAKMQEIADVLGLKLNTITSGSDWYLYACDEHPKSGVHVIFKDSYLSMFLHVDGAPSNGGTDAPDTSTSSTNYRSRHRYLAKDDDRRKYSKYTKLYYIKGCDGTVIFWLGGYITQSSNEVANESLEGLLITKATNPIDSKKVTIITSLWNNTDSTPIIHRIVCDTSEAYKSDRFLYTNSDCAAINTRKYTILTPGVVQFDNIYVFDNLYSALCFEHRHSYYFNLNDNDYYCWYGNSLFWFIMAVPKEE